MRSSLSVTVLVREEFQGRTKSLQSGILAFIIFKFNKIKTEKGCEER